MSNPAQIGSIAGLVVGAAIAIAIPGTAPGVIALAASAGSLVGGLAGQLYQTATAPDTKQEQQSIEDLHVQSSALGGIIPQIVGEFGNIAGNIIWATDKVEHQNRETTRVGKGGPKNVSITKTYSVSMAIAFCDTRITGPVEIVQVFKDYTLIYDESDATTLPENWTLYTGTNTQTADPTMEAEEGTGNVPAYRYLCYMVIDDEDLGPAGNTPNFTATLRMAGSNTLADVIPLLLAPCGLDESLDIDAADLVPAGIQTDCAFAIVARQQVRAILEHLAQAYRFYMIESGEKLKFRQIESGNTYFNIPEVDTDTAEDRSAGNGVQITRTDDIALPTELDVGYIDAEQNYQGNTQRAQRTLAVDAFNAPQSTQFPLVLESGTAKAIACELLYNAWIGREGIRTTLGRKWAFLEPGDRGFITTRGITYTITLQEVSYGRPGIVEIAGAASVAVCGAHLRGQDMPAAGETPQPALEPVQPVGDTTAYLLNIPALTSSDSLPRYHVGYLYEEDTGFPGVALYRSVDSEATYQQIDAAFLDVITGEADLLMPGGTSYEIDDTWTVTVTLDKGELTSVSDLALLNGANLCMIGNEILGFGTATLTAALTYELSHLLRGRRGTEWAIDDHQADERFYLLDNGVRAISMSMADRYVERPYKAVTNSQDIADVTAQDFTPTAENLNGWSVAQPAAELDGADWVLTWRYRSRFAGDWVDTTGIGFDVDFNGFRLDLYSDNTYATLVASHYTDGGNPLDPEAVKTYTYDAATQTTDFGSTQSTIYYKIVSLTNAGVSYAAELVGA